VRLKVAEGGGEQAAGGRGCAGVQGDSVGMQWLEENAGLVRATMAPLVDQVRSTLDIVGEHLEGSGTTLNDVFLDYPHEPCWALRCMLANLQVWGTLGDQREDSEVVLQEPQQAPGPSFGGGVAQRKEVSERDIEHFLRKDIDGLIAQTQKASAQRLAELGRTLAPDTLALYHRRLARARVALVRREFRRRLGALQHACMYSSGGGAGDAQANEQAERLLGSVLQQLVEVESFVTTLSRFFKSVDLSLPYRQQQGQAGDAPQEATSLSDSSDEKLLDATQESIEIGNGSKVTPQPAIDHVTAGYIMHIDCGHNGVMDEVDLRQLTLHLHASHFIGGADASN